MAAESLAMKATENAKSFFYAECGFVVMNSDYGKEETMQHVNAANSISSPRLNLGGIDQFVRLGLATVMSWMVKVLSVA